MKRIAELKAQRAAKIKEARALLEAAKTEGRELTPEESTTWDTLTADAEALTASIEREERQAALDATVTDPPPTDPDPKPPAGITKDAPEPFQMMNVLRAANTGDWRKAKNEARISDQLEEWLVGHGATPTRGFRIPLDARLPVKEQREYHRKFQAEDRALFDQIESREIGKVAPSTLGAAVVATQLLPERFIEFLDSELVIRQLGATVLPGLVGDVEIPRQSAGAVATWIATEGGDGPNNELGTDVVALSPNTVSNRQLVTRRMLMQSTPAIEDLVRRDNARAVAKAIDLAAIDGSGAAGEPLGILNTAGVGAVTIAGAPTFPLMVEFQTDLNAADAPMNGRSFLFEPVVAGELRTTPKLAATSSGFLMDDEGRVAGAPSRQSTVVPADTGIYGAWTELLLGFWGVYDAFANPYTNANSGGVILHAFQDADVGVRHAASFTAAEDF